MLRFDAIYGPSGTAGGWGNHEENEHPLSRHLLQVRLKFFKQRKLVSSDTRGKLLPLLRGLRMTWEFKIVNFAWMSQFIWNVSMSRFRIPFFPDHCPNFHMKIGKMVSSTVIIIQQHTQLNFIFNFHQYHTGVIRNYFRVIMGALWFSFHDMSWQLTVVSYYFLLLIAQGHSKESFLHHSHYFCCSSEGQQTHGFPRYVPSVGILFNQPQMIVWLTVIPLQSKGY